MSSLENETPIDSEVSKKNVTVQQTEFAERIMILRNFILTLPSILYHGTKSLIQKFKSNNKNDIIFNEVNTENLILLVHGYHGHPCNFTPLINNLVEIDPKINDVWNIRAVNLNQFDNYDNNTVENEAQLIQNYLELTEFSNVILIGLSKGGLVCAKIYANTNLNVKKLITISSPLVGTRACDLFLPKILDCINGNLDTVRKDLGYKSSVSCNTLNALMESNDCDKNNIYHIVPQYDHLIFPSSTAMYDFVKEENIMRYNNVNYSHIGMPFNKEIAVSINKWINN